MNVCLKENKIWSKLEYLALAVGLGATIHLTISLGTNYNKIVKFVEPIAIIRWSEVILGIMGIIIMIVMIWRKLKNEN